jgi:hypothetical protein
MADEAGEYWKTFEEETGEKVEARSLGEWYEAESGAGLWGLLILTDKSFRFKHVPSDNWMSSLFKRVEKSSKRKPVDIRIAREDLVSLVSPKRGLFAKLVGPAFPHFSITGRVADGEKTYSFSLDPSSGLLAALERVMGK